MAIENGDLGEDRVCCDLGCGTGMLAIGAAFCCDFVLAVDCDADAIEIAHQNAQQVELEETIQFVLARVEMKQPAISQQQQQQQQQQSASRGGKNARGGGRGRGRGKGRGGGAPAGSPNDSSSSSSEPTKDRIAVQGHDGIPLLDNCVDTVLTNPPFGTKQNAGMDVQFLRTACRLARRAVYSFHKTSTRTFLLKTLHEWGHTAQVVAEMKFDIPQMYKFHKQKSVDIQVDLIRVSIDNGGGGGGGGISPRPILEQPDENDDEYDDYEDEE
jgi:predicted RNA methylase